MCEKMLLSSELSSMNHTPSINTAPSEAWERFMILWNATPEIYIGSCLLSLFFAIYVMLVTRNDVWQLTGYMDGFTGTDKEEEEGDDLGSLQLRTKVGLEASTSKTGDLNYKDVSSMVTEQSDMQTLLQSCPNFKSYLHRRTAEKLKARLTKEQLEEEHKIQQEQLKAIFALMKGRDEVFGIHYLSQVEEQMRLYN